MAKLGSRLLTRDQFVALVTSNSGTTYRPVLSEILFAALATVPTIVVLVRDVRVAAAAGLLTATAILTGLTFTMAMRFWERSIDARSDPDYIADGRRLYILDKMRAHLVWTVLTGVTATGYLALSLVFSAAASPVWSSAIMTFLVCYQVLLVGGALLRFYEMSYLLRP
jgi:hypothetical protein